MLYLCPRCRIKKERSEFHGTSRRSPYCRECTRDYNLESYYENHDKMKEKARVQHAKHREKRLAHAKETYPKQAARIKARNLRIRGAKFTKEEIENLIATRTTCGICGMTAAESGSALHIDHDHETGRLRDMLCRYCNGGLGFFRDNIVLLQKAQAYLLRSRDISTSQPAEGEKYEGVLQ